MKKEKKKEKTLQLAPTAKKRLPIIVGLKTASAKKRIIEALISPEIFTVRAACEKAGVHFWTHYEWLKTDPEYKEECEKAYELQTQNLEQEAARRALGVGCKQPSDMLMMFLLNGRRPDVYKRGINGSDAPVLVQFTLNLGDKEPNA